jgi:hypothetical protein
MLKNVFLKIVIWQLRVNKDIYRLSSYLFFVIALHFPLAGIFHLYIELADTQTLKGFILSVEPNFLALIIAGTLAMLIFPNEKLIKKSLDNGDIGSAKTPILFALVTFILFLLSLYIRQ